MKMIVHQAIRVNLPVRLGTDFAQSGDKPFAVKIIVKDWLAPVAAIHHVINRAGIFKAQLPGHGKNPTASPRAGNKTGAPTKPHPLNKGGGKKIYIFCE